MQKYIKYLDYSIYYNIPDEKILYIPFFNYIHKNMNLHKYGQSNDNSVDVTHM